ncbi:hypothetical protein [Thauera humireducens]|uniref:hypothetical protein n=1 Tax=Thauera humireducens TaxID=1134435 RepID=UPI003C7820D3
MIPSRPSPLCCAGGLPRGFCAKVNPNLARLQTYPFEKLRALFAGITRLPT